MQFQSEILRFQEGARSHHPSPEATIVAARPGMLTDAGERIAVLVDLTPRLTYRSREIRTLTVKTYWASSGSVVARLRRALAAANRHLLHINSGAPPGSKCSGSISCAVFSQEELFLGQVGSAYAFILHPPGVLPRFEVFPRRERLLIPLGATTPPAINISYTVLEAGCSAFFATTLIAESQARELWQKVMTLPTLQDITHAITQEMSFSKPSGSVILVKGLTSNKTPTQLTSARLRRQSLEEKKLSHHTPAQPYEPERPEKPAEQMMAASMRQISTSTRDSVAALAPSATAVLSKEDTKASTIPVVEKPVMTTPPLPQPPISTSQATKTTAQQQERPAFFASTAAKIRRGFAMLHDRTTRFRNNLRERQDRGTARETTAERARLRKSLRSLLPGKVEGLQYKGQKTPPAEKSSVLGGVVAGITAVVILISLTTYMQFGGPLKAAELMTQAKELRTTAYSSQKPEDWYQLRDLCGQIVRLDAQNVDALNMKLEAEQAIDALENAAVLNVTPLIDLGTSPTPRHIVAGGSWVYVLDTAADDIIGLPLNSDRLSTSANAPSMILKRGQSLDGQQVAGLIDFDWIEPGGIYRDGALFVYSDKGIIYIYEPTLGPNSTQSQKLQGEFSDVAVTAMATFGTKLYFVHRQDNQILMYEPINGIYESPRLYFAEETQRDLTSVIDIAIDGRIYLLMGDGTLRTYFAGAEDFSFSITDLPDQDSFSPSVIAVESDPENGLLYFGDKQRERIVALNKLGEFMHQFRLPGDELQRIEALTVNIIFDEEQNTLTRILYFIAANRLYTARLPDFL